MLCCILGCDEIASEECERRVREHEVLKDANVEKKSVNVTFPIVSGILVWILPVSFSFFFFITGNTVRKERETTANRYGKRAAAQAISCLSYTVYTYYTHVVTPRKLGLPSSEDGNRSLLYTLAEFTERFFFYFLFFLLLFLFFQSCTPSASLPLCVGAREVTRLPERDTNNQPAARGALLASPSHVFSINERRAASYRRRQGRRLWLGSARDGRRHKGPRRTERRKGFSFFFPPSVWDVTHDVRVIARLRW